jgi:hypothetical protein
VIVSHRHRFIFIKTTKTAGTSVEMFLRQFCGPDDIVTSLRRDEEREVATLIQTRKITRRPVIGIGQEFWSGVRRTVTETMLTAGAIDDSEADIITIVDDAEAAVDLVVRATR